MTTVRDLIEDSFREAGILGLGQSMKAEDYQLALRRLRWMMSQWNRKRWLVYNLVNHSVEATGESSYSVGPSGDINLTERPDKLESAFLQTGSGGAFSVDFDDDFDITGDLGNTDVPLRILGSREDYNLVVNKRTAGTPAVIYYEPSFPLGRFFLNPVPRSGSCQITITCKVILEALSTLDTEIELPAEYYAALHYNLALRLGAAYRKIIHPAVEAFAKDSLNVIRNANTQVPLLHMPAGLNFQRQVS